MTQNGSVPSTAQIAGMFTTGVIEIVLRLLRDNQIEGYCGKLNAATNTWELSVPTRTGYIYVTLKTNSPTAPIEALCTEITPKAGLPVYVTRDIHTGEFLVKVNPVQMNASAPGVNLGTPKHTHRLGFGNEDVLEALRFEPLLAHVLSGGNSLYIEVNEGFYRYQNNNIWFPGGNIDLTSYRPATASTWCWVLVGIDMTDNTLIAVAGSEYSVVYPLSPTELQDIDLGADALPIAGVKLKNAQSFINDWRIFYDVRPFASGQNAPASATAEDTLIEITGTSTISANHQRLVKKIIVTGTLTVDDDAILYVVT